MPRDPEIYLEDIENAIKKTRDTPKTFLNAVTKNLENIGEAVKNIPDELKQKDPNTPYNDISGIRDILIHQYFRADRDIIWDIIQNELPPLQKAIQNIRKQK